jgi:hypothetical protein
MTHEIQPEEKSIYDLNYHVRAKNGTRLSSLRPKALGPALDAMNPSFITDFSNFTPDGIDDYMQKCEQKKARALALRQQYVDQIEILPD